MSRYWLLVYLNPINGIAVEMHLDLVEYPYGQTLAMMAGAADFVWFPEACGEFDGAGLS